MIQDERISFLNDKKIEKDGEYVLYWMQQSCRTEYNHALEYAILKANDLSLPLIVMFGITDNYPEANERHYYFMLEGLRDVKDRLNERGIRLIVLHHPPDQAAIKVSKMAALCIVDKGYLRVQREWRRNVADKINIPFVEVESDLIVPIETVSEKEEYAAYTIRKKINRLLDDYMIEAEENEVQIKSIDYKLEFENEIDIRDIDKAIEVLEIDRSVAKSRYYSGGSKQAKEILEEFVEHKLQDYAVARNNPAVTGTSDLSLYLHFGHISALEIAITLRKITDVKYQESINGFLEEMIVRRELAFNFVYYNPDYDNYKLMNSSWAHESLQEHSEDSREFIYSRDQFESAVTHDKIWNACQEEMVKTGKMHGYMRMYWGKKIIEWSETPEEAFYTCLYLNNKYCIDGRDANSFAGVAWCFGKHDRPWKERAVFGKIRYMNANGLRRKFDVEAYVERVSNL